TCPWTGIARSSARQRSSRGSWPTSANSAVRGRTSRFITCGSSPTSGSRAARKYPTGSGSCPAGGARHWSYTRLATTRSTPGDRRGLGRRHKRRSKDERPPESRMMGNYHVRFGGGPTEKDPRGYLAGGLPYDNGTDARWLELVRPELAVASVGAGDEYGHPGSHTLASLARSGIPLLRTDRDGTVAIESDGRGWRVVGRRVDTRGPPLEKGRSK